MKRYTLPVLVVGVFLSTQTANAEGPAKEKDKLKGTWAVVSAERNGEKSPEEKVKKLKVIFRSDKVIVTDGDRDDQADYKLDPAKKPSAIDFMPVKEKKVVLGIYLLEGDTLKICYDPDEAAQGRPEEFTSKGGKGRVLMVLKREKP
jgi:uncharacterized protein (TIGR03067 family)